MCRLRLACHAGADAVTYVVSYAMGSLRQPSLAAQHTRIAYKILSRIFVSDNIFVEGVVVRRPFP